MPKEVIKFNEYDYLIDQMCKANPDKTEQEMREILENFRVQYDWQDLTFEVNRYEGGGGTIKVTDNVTGKELRKDDLTISTTREFYHQLAKGLILG